MKFRSSFVLDLKIQLNPLFWIPVGDCVFVASQARGPPYIRNSEDTGRDKSGGKNLRWRTEHLLQTQIVLQIHGWAEKQVSEGKRLKQSRRRLPTLAAWFTRLPAAN